MTSEEVFKQIVSGVMTFVEFEEWLSDKTHTAYCDGAAQQGYESAMAYQGSAA